MVLCPPSPGSQLLRAGVGAGLAQTEVLDSSAEWTPGWHLAGCSQTFSGISWTHAHILPLPDCKLLVGGDWLSLSVPSPSLAHDGSTQDVLGS